MQIACAHCQAGYEVPEDRLYAGLRLHCSQCGAEWRYVPPDEPATPARLPDPVPDSSPAPAREIVPFVVPQDRALASPAPGGRGLAVAWALSLLVVAGLVGAGLVWHARVAAVWPASARLFAALGF